MARNQIARAPRPWERARRSLVLNIFLLALAGVVGYEAYRTGRAVEQARREHGRIAGEIEALVRRRAELDAALLELRMPQAREREAKARLNLKRRGEEVVVVPPDEPRRVEDPRPSLWISLRERVRFFFRSLVFF